MENLKLETGILDDTAPQARVYSFRHFKPFNQSIGVCVRWDITQTELTGEIALGTARAKFVEIKLFSLCIFYAFKWAIVIVDNLISIQR